MKFKILSLMLLSLIGATSVKNGEDAPLFNLLNQDDQTVSLEEFKGTGNSEIILDRKW